MLDIKDHLKLSTWIYGLTWFFTCRSWLLAYQLFARRRQLESKYYDYSYLSVKYFWHNTCLCNLMIHPLFSFFVFFSVWNLIKFILSIDLSFVQILLVNIGCANEINHYDYLKEKNKISTCTKWCCLLFLFFFFNFRFLLLVILKNCKNRWHNMDSFSN